MSPLGTISNEKYQHQLGGDSARVLPLGEEVEPSSPKSGDHFATPALFIIGRLQPRMRNDWFVCVTEATSRTALQVQPPCNAWLERTRPLFLPAPATAAVNAFPRRR